MHKRSTIYSGPDTVCMVLPTDWNSHMRTQNRDRTEGVLGPQIHRTSELSPLLFFFPFIAFINMQYKKAI